MIHYDLLLRNNKSVLVEFAMLVAYAVIAIQGKKEDDISETKARKRYGYQWIEDRTNRGIIHYNRNGADKSSTKMYSVLEIEAAKLAEKGMVYQAKFSEEAIDKKMEELKIVMDTFK